MADDQAPDALWHFERTHRFGGPERVGLSDGGTTPAGDRYLDLSVWNDDENMWITVALPWAAVRELADEVIQDWLYTPSVAGAHDAGHGDGDGGREGEPVGPADPTH